MAKHSLKTHPEYFVEVMHGVKTFEIRDNDRNFDVGDLLELCEYEPIADEFSGRHLHARVTYKTDYQQIDNYVVLGIRLEGFFCD